MKTSDAPVIVCQKFDLSPHIVWEAITQYDKMTAWFFEELTDFQAKERFYTEFLIRSGERNFTHQWQITEVIPFKRIVYSWKYKEYPGDSVFKMELDAKGVTTELKVSHRCIDNFPSEIPEFSRESCLMGWKYFINERLANYLKNHQL